MEEYPQINYIYNEKFHQTNTSKSLQRAFQAIKAPDDIMWINGDVFLPINFPIKKFAERKGNIILCNADENCGKEEVKYRTNSYKQISELSKQVAESEGEALGLNIIRARYFKQFKNALKACADQDYFEKACEFCIQKKVKFRPYVTQKPVREIDTHQDLKSVYDLG
jgi:choline kinase